MTDAAGGGGLAASSAFRHEVEEQLADTLYKRAQAKMMVHADPINIESGLADVLKAISFVDDEDDFHLLAATCHIRLGRYKEAVAILEYVLHRSPDNHKAIYNLSFCKRAAGNQKEAIDGLTKVSA